MLRVPNQATDKWRPKQCVEVNGAVFSEIAGNGSQKIAKHIVSLVGPFPPGSVLLDNACGKGIVSKEIIAIARPDLDAAQTSSFMPLTWPQRWWKSVRLWQSRKDGRNGQLS
jgi:hypothetical protein